MQGELQGGCRGDGGEVRRAAEEGGGRGWKVADAGKLLGRGRGDAGEIMSADQVDRGRGWKVAAIGIVHVLTPVMIRGFVC